MEEKNDMQDNTDRRGHRANVQDNSANNKAIFFSIHKQFGSFLSDNIALTAFIIAKENDKAVTALRRSDILQGQYPACIHLCRKEIYLNAF